MKVVFIEQESQLGGVEYSTLRVAQVLDKSKFETVIICPKEGDLPRLARLSNLEIQIVPRPKFLSVSFNWGDTYVSNPFGFIVTAINVFRSMLILKKHLQTNLVDVIITKGLLTHFYGGVAARKLHIPCIWYVQEEVDKRRVWGLFRLILVKGAQKIPAKILVDAAALLEQFDSIPSLRNSIDVVYNGIDVQQFTPFSRQEKQEARKNFRLPANATVIGQVGRIIQSKGQITLLQAFVRLANDFPDIHLLFVGTSLFSSQDYEQKLRTEAAQLGLGERVHFSGFIPDVRDGLAAMDIFVHASVETDSPISVIEAMSCGLPVVVSRVRGTAEMVTPNVNALIFEPGNTEGLAFTLDRLLKSKQMQRELGEQARAAVLERFSLQTSVVQLQTLIEKVYAA